MHTPVLPHLLSQFLVLLLLGAPGLVQAFEARILEHSERELRILVDVGDLRVEPIDTPDGLRGLPVSAGAGLFQDGGRTWLSGAITLVVPPGSRPQLQIIAERISAPEFPPPASIGDIGDSLSLVPGGPQRPGLRLLDLGWQRSRKLQRLALDLAVYDKGWQRLESLEFRLVFVPDAREQSRLASGDTNPSGPWQEAPVFERMLAKQVLNFDQARSWTRDPRALIGGDRGVLTSLNPALQDAWIHRIMVNQDGLVRVREEDLRAAGVDTDQIDPATLSLWMGGQERPLFMHDGADGSFDRGDSFVFLGRARRGTNFPTSFYSPENAYFLTWGHGTGRRFVDRSSPPLAGLPDLEQYRLTEHYEINREWTSLEEENRGPDETDHWQWRLFTAIGTPQTYTQPIALEDALGGSGAQLDHIRFAVRGNSVSNAGGADHHAVVRLDGQWIGDLNASRQSESITEWFPLPPGALAGLARVELDFELPLDRGAESDLLYLNWIDLDYLRQLRLRDNGQLILPADQARDRNLLVRGLANEIPLLLSEDGWRLLGAESVDGSPGSVRINGGDLEGDLFIAGYSTLHAPARIVRHLNAHLRDEAQQADMLIVSPSQYHNQLEELADYHRESMTVKVVDIEAIYSEFGQGLMHTQALQDFLLHTFSDWQTPSPTYLTLVGKASRANDMTLNREPRYRTQVPTWYVQTSTSGASATDETFTYLVGTDSLWSNARPPVFEGVVPDTFQDLLVGRIPIYTATQLAAYLEKHREYRERQFPGPWMETQFYAADRGNEQVFEVGNELAARTTCPESFPVAQLHVRADSPYRGGALDFIDLFNEGCSVLNYNGHGAIGILSSSSLFRATDIRFLTNRGKYPINFAWSCLVGYFDDPDSSSMAELLLHKARAGSIAFYGSSAKATITVDNPLMQNYFYNQYDPQPLSFGEVVQLTENTLLLTSGNAGIIHMYNLLGDPALAIDFPRQQLLPDSPMLLQSDGETATFTLSTEPPGLSGTLEITFQPEANRPANFQGSLRRTWSQAFSDGQSLSLTLPAVGEARQARLLFAMTTATGRAVGQLPLFLNSPYAGVGSHSPFRGLAGAPLQFQFESPLDVDSVQIMTNIWVDSLARIAMQPLGGGRFGRQITSLPAYSYGQYRTLDAVWLEEWDVNVSTWPSPFFLNGLLYRFRVYDWEPWVDANNDGRYNPGETYTDANANEQWDPAGEPFTDTDLDGVFDIGEVFEDLNENGLRDAWIDLPGRFVSILQNERLSSLDSLITIAGDAAALQADYRWSVSASRPLDQASVDLREWAADSTWRVLWSGRRPATSGTVHFHEVVTLAPGPKELRFTAGPVWLGETQVVGIDSFRATDSFWLLTPQAGAGSGRAALDALWGLNLAAGALQAPAQLDPRFLATAVQGLREENQGQPGLGFLMSEGADSLLKALDLGPRPTDRSPADLRPTGGSVDCRIRLGARFRFPDGVLGDSLPLALARWIPERGLWVVQPGSSSATATERTLSANLALQDGWLHPVALRDATGPVLSLQVSGQWFTAGDVVPREPVFQFQIQDVDGIDLGEGRGMPQILLDGVPAPTAQLQVGEGTTGLFLQWSPGMLEPGSSHELTLRANDALGNASEIGSTFRVATDLALDFFANHPNPFQNSTTFAWQLSNLPGSLRFEIFTAAGRLVRRIPITSPRIGYDEYIWDGNDQEGREVANGVYFVRVIGSGNGAFDEVFKLARLK